MLLISNALEIRARNCLRVIRNSILIAGIGNRVLRVATRVDAGR